MTHPDYRIIVCGGRDYGDAARVAEVLGEYAWYDPVIVHGDARGADTLAHRYAVERGLRVEPHPAFWDALGRGAGAERNGRMVKAGADLCIAFPGGKGTADMIRQARRGGIAVREVEP